MSISREHKLLELTSNGLYCPQADVFLDPWRPVNRAIITHAHSDHARPGSLHYLTHHKSVPLLHLRLGTAPHQVEGLEYGEVRSINGVQFSLQPAGHVVGSSQILVEYKGERWVFSGDYKIENDELCAPFAPVQCHTFISECTFGLPIFRWRPQKEVFADLHAWVDQNRERGVSSIVCAYALGKAQRVLTQLPSFARGIVLHGAVWNTSQALALPMERYKHASASSCQPGTLVLAPPSVIGSSWLKRFAPYEIASVSGWMAIRGIKRRRGVDRGYVLSDHADFAGLTAAVKATGAERVLLTHGYTTAFARWLCSLGIDAQVLTTHFEGDEGYDSESAVQEGGGA